VAAPAAGKEFTSIMLRNLPNNITRNALLEMFDYMGFNRKYDFVYLPMDFARSANLGYAFLNLIDAASASEFWRVFDGFSGWKGTSQKVCRVQWSTPMQGLHEHIERYRNSQVMHHEIPDECKPVRFNDGQRVPFPAPTKVLRRPRPFKRR